jgi:CDP-L-myo-inositol myo-inositolphosphotransferase
MKALIIAAGRGSRLTNLLNGKPKPLLPLLGLSLIERVILTAKEAGILEFLVVIGYKGKEIKEKLGNGERYGVNITYIENKEWEKGNGISVLKAKGLKEDFFLLMADHIIESKTLKRLKRQRKQKEDCILVIDREVKNYLDEKEATKVKTEETKIVDIGKRIHDYNAFDCGIFLLSPSFFKALEESIRKGDDSVSGGVRIQAQKGKMKFLDIKGDFWIDIDTEEQYKICEKMLLKGLTKPTDGPVSKYINRPVSTRISKLLVKTNISPNAISFLSFLIALLSALFFILGEYLYIAIAGILSQFSSTIDGCDGEIARLKFRESDYGAWFDAVLDRYADALIILGMIYGWWSLHTSIEVWIFGFAALIGGFMNSYTAVRYNAKFKEKIRFGRDCRLFLVMIGALLNQLLFTLAILAILTNFVSVKRLLNP